jgi:NhaA family Na+:H+ antiporter
VAACGGVLVPIVLFSVFNAGTETAGGWGVPTATDIAFALGILALLGDRVPNGVRVFLSTLAVADDIIAILVIAIFYGQAPQVGWLLAAGAVMAVLITMNKKHVYSLAPYLAVGVVLWYCVFMSGVHSTIAGVLLAFTIPCGSRVNTTGFAAWSNRKVDQANRTLQPDQPVLAQKDYLHTVQNLSNVAKQVVPPAARLEHRLYPWVYFLILPLFALTNADVSLAGTSFGEACASPAFLGVFFGLLLGKPLGILAFSFAVVKSKLASLPAGTTWMQLVGAAVLGGVGFTMAIFVANLAFESELAVTAAKLGILTASALAGIVGLVLLTLQAKRSSHEKVD